MFQRKQSCEFKEMTQEVALPVKQPKTYQFIPSRLSSVQLLKRQPFCDICEAFFFKTKATHLCIECQKLLCNGCTRKHTDSKLFVDHGIFSLIGYDGVTLHCQAHPQESVQIYCETCSTAICVVCALSIHNDHRIQGFKGYVREQRNAIETLLEESKARQVDGFHIKQGIEKDILKNESDFHATSKEITSAFKMLQDALDKRHDVLQKELAQVYSQKQAKMVNNMQLLHDRMFHLIDHTKMAKQIVENDIKMIKLNQQFINNFRRSFNIDENLADEVGQPDTLRFVPSYDINLGMIKTTEVPLKPESQDSTLNERLHLNLDMSSSLGFHDDLHLSSNPNSEFPSPRDMLSFPDLCMGKFSGTNSEVQSPRDDFQVGQHNTLNTLSQSLHCSLMKISNTQAKVKLPCSSPFPEHVTQVRPNLSFHHPDDTDISLLYTIEYKAKTCSDPSGYGNYELVPINIAFKNEHKVFVTEWGILPRQKYFSVPTYYPSKTGMVLYSLCFNELSTEKCFENCSPWAVVVHDGTCYVTDNRCTQRTIHKYQDDGTLQHSWSTHRFTHPRGMTIKDDRVMVTDISNKQVRVFTEDEFDNQDIILKLGKPGRYRWAGSSQNLNNSFNEYSEEETLFDDPEFIATNENGWMIVSDMGDNTIKVFDTDGERLFNIQSFNGQKLRTPMGVTTDLKNNIYVADYGNNQIVKFNEEGQSVQVILNGQDNKVYKPRGLAFYDHLIAVSCHNENGEPEVKIFEMNYQLSKPTAFRCPCNWIRLCTQDETTKL